MEVKLPKGRYVLAVSGGVDSVALLHALQDRTGIKLVVAHFDHGMRSDSRADSEFVRGLAGSYGLPFVAEEGKLGSSASEAAAREARYGFLRRTKDESGARAIVTAHHRDDALETAIINLIRGSGRKGLTSLASREDVERPLLDIPKEEVIAYARKHGLEWHEDPTNLDTGYLRNHVRHGLLPRFGAEDRERLWKIIEGLRATNAELDVLLADRLSVRSSSGKLERAWFISLPHGVAREVMAAWLRARGVRGFDSRTLERLVAAAKTAAPGKVFDISKGAALMVEVRYLALKGLER